MGPRDGVALELRPGFLQGCTVISWGLGFVDCPRVGWGGVEATARYGTVSEAVVEGKG